MNLPARVLTAYLDAGLLEPDSPVAVQVGRARQRSLAGGAYWHAAWGGDCPEYPEYIEDGSDPDGDGSHLTAATHIATAAEILAVVVESERHISQHHPLAGDIPGPPSNQAADEAGSAIRILCGCGITCRWAPVSDADHEALVWVAEARRALASGDDHIDPRDLHDALWGWSHYHPRGDGSPIPLAATHPAVITLAAAARDELLSHVGADVPTETKVHILGGVLGAYDTQARRGRLTPLIPESRTELLEAHIPDLKALTTTWLRRDRDTARQGRMPDAATVAATWDRVMGVQAWWVGATRVTDAVDIADYDLATGAIRGPLLHDVRNAEPTALFCLDRGYTADEVAAAWRVLGPAPTPLGHDRAAADFIDAYRTTYA